MHVLRVFLSLFEKGTYKIEVKCLYHHKTMQSIDFNFIYLMFSFHEFLKRYTYRDKYNIHFDLQIDLSLHFIVRTNINKIYVHYIIILLFVSYRCSMNIIALRII